VSWRASAYVKALVTCPNGERISRAEKLVALVLADSHQDKGEGTYPAVRTIAEDALMDERVCRRMLAALERKGVITRIRAANQGRGQFTFYRFPALDEHNQEHNHGQTAGKKSAAVTASAGKKSAEETTVENAVKGGQGVPLFLGKRRTEGGRKEDKTAPPYMEEQEQEQKQIPAPCSPSPGEGQVKPSCRVLRIDQETPEMQRAIDQVMQACGWTKPRLRRKLRLAIQQEEDLGEAAAAIALKIIAEWKYQERNAELLFAYGPANFIELGVFKSRERLKWNQAALERQRQLAQARVGSF
jgi:hypothetical protein